MKFYKTVVRRLVEVPGLVTFGHYSGWPCGVLAIAMRVALVLWGYPACYAVGALMLPFLIALIAHSSGICQHGKCAVLMSATPTEAAQRYRWWLHHVHHQLTSAATWGLLAVWFWLTFIVVNPIASGIPVVALLAIDLRALRLHSQLRPWCRWCNGRGKDDEDPIDPPPPGGLAEPVPPERIKEYAH